MVSRGIAKLPIVITLGLMLAVGVVGLGLYLGWFTPAPAPIAATQPAATTSPTTLPAPKEPEKLCLDLLDVIHDQDPKYATTQPLDWPVSLRDADRILLRSPVYLDPMGDLWITHPRGQTLPDIIHTLARQRTHVTRAQVLFVHWTFDVRNKRVPIIVYREDGQIKILSRAGEQPLNIDRNFRWNEGITWNGRMLIPTDRGISILTVDPQPTETFLEIFPKDDDLKNAAKPTAILDALGVLAFAPWDNGKRGSSFFLRHDGKITTRLDAASGYLSKPLQIVPLLDGSQMLVGLDKDDQLELKLQQAQASIANIDESKVRELVKQLSNIDPLERAKATDALEQMGPSIWPLLETLKDKQPPEGQMRLQVLLAERLVPTLGGNAPRHGIVMTLARYDDGGCVLYFTGGVSFAAGSEHLTQVPAAIALLPGRNIERLDAEVIKDFSPGKSKLSLQADDWLRYDSDQGYRRWIGNSFEVLTNDHYKDFDRFVGIDASRRYIFASTAQPDVTLLIDPNLPDPTPRLPIWTTTSPDGAGWTSTQWPALQRGKQVYVAVEGGWRLIDPKTEQFVAKDAPALPAKISAPDGISWTLDADQLIRTDSKNQRTAITLPSEVRSGKLLAAQGNLIFFLTDSAIWRCRMDEGQLLPEKPFAEKLVKDSRRIWIDPVGRIVIATETELHIAYPTGLIPPAVQKLMLENTKE